MEKRVLKILISVIVALFMLINVACAPGVEDNSQSNTSVDTSSKNEIVTISLIGGQPDYPEGFDDILERIKQDEGIEVDKQIVENWNDIIKVRLATNQAPDLVLGNVPSAVPLFNGTENFVVLDDQPWVSRLVNPELIRYNKDGHIYAMPFLSSSSLFGACYYNKEVMDDLGISNPNPKTYAEFINILETIKNSGKDIVPFYMSDATSWTTQIFAALGMGVATKDKPEIFEQIMTNKLKMSDVPEFIEVLAKFENLYKAGYVNKNHMSATFDNAKDALGTGSAAMIYQGEWIVPDIVNKFDIELGAFIIPFADEDIMATGSYVKGAFIPKKGENVEAAKRFLNLLSQPKYMNPYYESYPNFPAFKDIDGGEVYPAVKSLVDNYIATGKYAYQINDYFGDVSSILENHFWPELAMLALGESTPEKALEVFDDALQDAAKEAGLPGFS